MISIRHRRLGLLLAAAAAGIVLAIGGCVAWQYFALRHAKTLTQVRAAVGESVDFSPSQQEFLLQYHSWAHAELGTGRRVQTEELPVTHGEVSIFQGVLGIIQEYLVLHDGERVQHIYWITYD